LFLQYQNLTEDRERIQKESDYARGLQIRTLSQLRDNSQALENELDGARRQLENLREEKRNIENFAHECIERAKMTIKDLEAKNAAANAKIQSLQAEIQNLQTEIAKLRSSEIETEAEGASNMKIVSVINYKGGVGKTTVTANIATYIASKGKRVLMIDLDPQTNLTLSFMNNEHGWRSTPRRKLSGIFSSQSSMKGDRRFRSSRW
jgi:Flp pilus assembly CpaE family ATPase